MPTIDHVFVLMLENRSFDHMLGFSGITGVGIDGQPTKIDGLTGTESNPLDPTAAGSKMVAVTADADFSVNPDPGHEFEHVRLQLCGPSGNYPNILNNGFIACYAQRSKSPADIMRCFSADRLPVLTTLARQFAVCDAWHSGLPGPTWPNRFFVHAATSGGLDASPDTDDTLSAEFLEGYSFLGGTIYDALEKSGKAWRVYHGDPLPQVLAVKGMHSKYIDPAASWFREFEHFREDLQTDDFGPSYIFIEPDYGNVTTSNVTKDFLGGNSQHPVGNVADGEQLIKEVYEALRTSPLWPRSALIITYDEHGGFYDHVKPGAVVPTGDDSRYNQKGFDFKTLGVRVPALVISPWIPANTIDHRCRDHSAVLATVERLFGLKPLTARDAAATPVNDLFTLSSPRTDAPETLPEPVKGTAASTSNPGIDGELDSATESFLHLAGSVESRLSKDAGTTAAATVKSIDDKGDAKSYIQNVAAKLKTIKL